MINYLSIILKEFISVSETFSGMWNVYRFWCQSKKGIFSYFKEFVETQWEFFILYCIVLYCDQIVKLIMCR